MHGMDLGASTNQQPFEYRTAGAGGLNRQVPLRDINDDPPFNRGDGMVYSHYRAPGHIDVGGMNQTSAMNEETFQQPPNVIRNIQSDDEEEQPDFQGALSSGNKSGFIAKPPTHGGKGRDGGRLETADASQFNTTMLSQRSSKSPPRRGSH
jgi:hypothetical protein